MASKQVPSGGVAGCWKVIVVTAVVAAAAAAGTTHLVHVRVAKSEAVRRDRVLRELQSSDPDTRLFALRKLVTGTRGRFDPSIYVALSFLREDPHPLVRVEAADVLMNSAFLATRGRARWRHPALSRVIGDVVRATAEDPSPTARFRCRVQLTFFLVSCHERDPRSEEPLVIVLDSMVAAASEVRDPSRSKELDAAVQEFADVCGYDVASVSQAREWLEGREKQQGRD